MRVGVCIAVVTLAGCHVLFPFASGEPPTRTEAGRQDSRDGPRPDGRPDGAQGADRRAERTIDVYACSPVSTQAVVMAHEDAWVSAEFPDTVNPGYDDQLWVGRYQHEKRTYLKFDYAAAGIPMGACLVHALLVYCVQGAGSKSPVPVRIQAVSWSEASLTWNSQPSATGSPITANINTGNEERANIQSPMSIAVTPLIPGKIVSGQGGLVLSPDGSPNNEVTLYASNHPPPPSGACLQTGAYFHPALVVTYR